MIAALLTPTAIQSALLTAIITGIISLLAIRLRQKPALVRLEDDRHTAEIARLDERINSLERLLETERSERARERAEADTRAAEERRRHDRELGYMRHRLNNETHTFDRTLDLLRMNPDRVPEIVERMQQVREENARLLANERGAMMGAAVTPKT